MKLEVIDSKTWALHSEDAHKIAFGKVKPASWDRIDFALLAVDDSEMPMGYITCREHDHETIYWQFGGAFPGTKGTCKTWLIYNLANYHRDREHEHFHAKDGHEVRLYNRRRARSPRKCSS